MKILSLSDVIISFIYNPKARERFGNVDLLIGCGDLPYYYQEFLVSILDVPLYYVRGNHSKIIEFWEQEERIEPYGGVDLHRKAVNHEGLLMAGVEGSLRYCEGPYQYTQMDMWLHVFHLVPFMIKNRLLHGRFLDIFVTHASPWGIHDQPDQTHRGIKAFLWFVRIFQPALHLHGHIHVYRPDTVILTRVGRTQVINTFGYRETTVKLPARGERKPILEVIL